MWLLSAFGDGIDVIQGMRSRLERSKSHKLHHSIETAQIGNGLFDLGQESSDIFKLFDTEKRVASSVLEELVHLRLLLR